MVVLMLNQVVAHRKMVRLPEGGRQGGVESQFLRQATVRCINGGLSGLGMAAAGIRPEPSRVVLAFRALLEKKTTLVVEDKN
jgi:hypothetical protein